MDDQDDDDLTLSSTTQAALAEFLAEKQVREAAISTADSEEPVSIDSFPEDWQVSPRPPVPSAWGDNLNREISGQRISDPETTGVII